jgi:hypothetical protein
MASHSNPFKDIGDQYLQFCLSIEWIVGVNSSAFPSLIGRDSADPTAEPLDQAIDLVVARNEYLNPAIVQLINTSSSASQSMEICICET